MGSKTVYPLRAHERCTVEDGDPAGSYCVDLVARDFWYVCPCGCGWKGHLKLRAPDGTKPAGAAHSWNWNHETKTLTPSVNHVNHWHGHLKNGEWVLA